MPRKNLKKKEVESETRRLFKKHPNQKYTAKEISLALKINDKNLRKLILLILKDLKNEGFLSEYQTGVFVLNENYITHFEGTLDATKQGTAYVVVPELEGDIYIGFKHIENALDGDTVEVEIIKKSKRKIEGKITKIIKRKTNQFIGIVDIRKNFAFLITSNHKINIDLYIPLDKLKGAKSGQIAVARMTSWPKGVNNPFGEIIDVLGNPEDNETEMRSILMKNEFNLKFPKAVEEKAKKISVDLDEEEIKLRKDFRNKLTLTIDPFDAKDFDDALSYEKLKSGNIEVGVHIADVSHYVQLDTPLDEEAYKRGNSVYLEDRVIPMLPEQLSNVACSLRPEEDKYAFSVVFELNKKGEVLKEWFGKTVIRSNRRFTYEEAQAIIKGKDDEMKEAILALNEVAVNLRRERLKNGALAIESEEIRFKIDENGKPIGVVKKIQEDANKLVEEFMLLANKRVALFVGKLPDKKEYNNQFIYRCHDKPSVEKINTFAVFINKFGYNLELNDINEVAKKMNAFFETIKDTPEYSFIQTMAIRTMAKAEYQTNNIGHYGLAFDCYTHFTSPIRRYADLMVHRILLDKLQNKQKNYGNKLNKISEHISIQERKAIDAERESNKFFQAKFLNDRIGEEFEGTISGLTDFGMFVRLNDNYCEGLVMMSSLPDDTYFFNIDKFQIVGKRTHRKFNFGDQVSVKVVSANLLKKQIDLLLI